ncbi:MAG: hypothetical protein EOS82_30695 [Mesorhizobium sp.]|nr:MAG: hypothetical protein EOS82_30695 [Mesorhizobium sp.]
MVVSGTRYSLLTTDLFTIHYSLFTIHYLLFTIHYSLYRHRLASRKSMKTRKAGGTCRELV